MSSLPDVLVAFKAGKLTLTGSKLTADTRKGLLSIVLDDCSMMHVQWSDRSLPEGSAPVDDMIIFPGECSLNRIGSGRSYVLKFAHEPDRNLFFWLQEPDASADTDSISAFNSAASGEPLPASAAPSASSPAPPAPAATPLAASQPGRPPAASSTDLLAALLRSALAASSSAAPTSQTELLAASLASALAASGAGQQGGGMEAARGNQALAAALAAAERGPSLGEVLRPELLTGLVGEVPGALERLAEFLPEPHRNLPDLVRTLSSRSFLQQVASLGHALQGGQLSLAQFGLNPRGFSAKDFLEAIQEAADKAKQQQQQQQQQQPEAGADATMAEPGAN